MSTAIRRACSSAIRLAVFALVSVWLLSAGGPGFRSRRQLDDHFSKHGTEFGRITKLEYLRMAQELRDAPKAGDILEAVRNDGVMTRFQRKKGWFGAYNPDGTIRTFFIPNDGERYFRRQAARPQ
ncbi:MAG TPA: hypothetical protein VM120_00505 [Bryobacteraceae bacterium]|nr:hypothetical protein [Bryobacteraceae bacterium]